MPPERKDMDPRTATREQYLVMKARVAKAAMTVEAEADPAMRSIITGIGRWATLWVEEWESAHPGQSEHLL